MRLQKAISLFFVPLLFLVACAVGFNPKQKPTLYIIGDSTVRNTNEGYGGWGSYIAEQFDTTKIRVSNQAMAGRSTRTFIKEGRWDRVLTALKPGDFVLMQFGHNEGSEPDTSRAGYRGVLRGTGPETKKLTWKDGEQEVVHTYGWYLTKFVREAKEKGATPIIASMIPRNQWEGGKVLRADDTFGKWAREVAEAEGVHFINLNKITAEKYEQLGPEKVKALFPTDHTHTNPEGARINAASVAEGLKLNKRHPLKKYLKRPS
ncbi:rhamnogalacturonan acetylesterase [Pontibacter sp. CAU 1760]